MDRAPVQSEGHAAVRTHQRFAALQALQEVGEAAPEAQRIRLRSSWTCHAFFPLMNASHTFFGRAEYELALRDQTWLIAKKKTVLENDRIPMPIDVYCL